MNTTKRNSSKTLIGLLGLFICLVLISSTVTMQEELDWDNYVARVVPLSSSNVMIGEEYKAEIRLMPKRLDIDAFVRTEAGHVEMKNGVGHLIMRPFRPGQNDIEGVFTVRTSDGPKQFPFFGEMTASQGGAHIYGWGQQMYVGLQNKVSVSVPGISPSDVVVSAAGAGAVIKRAGHHYVVKPTTIGKVVVRVSVRYDDGTVRAFGSQQFKVVKLPRPQLRFGTMTPGRRYNKIPLLAQLSIRATLGQSFPLPGVKYLVKSYEMIHIPVNGERTVLVSQNDKITEEMKELIKNSKDGDLFLITNVKTIGPPGVGEPDSIFFEIAD